MANMVCRTDRISTISFDAYHDLIYGITLRLSIAVSRINGRGAQETQLKALTLQRALSLRNP